MDVASPPSLATATVAIPAKGLLGLVLRAQVHMLPCSKVWEPGTGNTDSGGRCSVVRQVTERAACSGRRHTLRCSGSQLPHWREGCWKQDPRNRGGLSAKLPPACTFSPFPAHQPFQDFILSPSCCSWPARGREPSRTAGLCLPAVPRGQHALHGVGAQPECVP